MTFEKFTYTVENPAAIRSIVLADADVPVEVLPSEDGRMYATYFESDKEKYNIEVDGDTLYIKKKIRIRIGLFMGVNTPDNLRLTMFLPAGYSGELSVSTVDGNIRVAGVSLGSAAIKTTDGDIAMSRTHIDSIATCKTMDGDITLGSITATEASVKTTDGNITLDRPLIANKLTCRTTDGDIRGLLKGRASDYTFAVRLVDGHSNIASGGTGRTLCEVKAIDGDIELAFEDAD